MTDRYPLRDSTDIYRLVNDLDLTQVAYVDGSTFPPSIVLNTQHGRLRALIGDTVNVHDDGTITITGNDQEGLW